MALATATCSTWVPPGRARSLFSSSEDSKSYTEDLLATLQYFLVDDDQQVKRNSTRRGPILERRRKAERKVPRIYDAVSRRAPSDAVLLWDILDYVDNDLMHKLAALSPRSSVTAESFSPSFMRGSRSFIATAFWTHKIWN